MKNKTDLSNLFLMRPGERFIVLNNLEFNNKINIYTSISSSGLSLSEPAICNYDDSPVTQEQLDNLVFFTQNDDGEYDELDKDIFFNLKTAELTVNINPPVLSDFDYVNEGINLSYSEFVKEDVYDDYATEPDDTYYYYVFNLDKTYFDFNVYGQEFVSKGTMLKSGCIGIDKAYIDERLEEEEMDELLFPIWITAEDSDGKTYISMFEITMKSDSFVSLEKVELYDDIYPESISDYNLLSLSYDISENGKVTSNGTLKDITAIPYVMKSVPKGASINFNYYVNSTPVSTYYDSSIIYAFNGSTTYEVTQDNTQSVTLGF